MPFRIGAAALAPLALVVAASSALALTPAVTLSPTGDHPKGSTQVSGTGFGATEAVDIYFDTTDEVLAATNASGKFGPIALAIPANALPGTHWITAVGRKDGIAAQHAFFVRTRWNSLGFNERGRRRNPYENVIDAANAADLDLAWTAATGGVVSSPAIAQIASTYDPYVFVGSQDGNLYAFDSTGAQKWSAAIGIIQTSPAISGSTVYAGTSSGNLYALKAATGAMAWSSPAATGAAIGDSPAVSNGIVYVGNINGTLSAFNASNGTLVWSVSTGTEIEFSSPAVADGIVYVGSADGKMRAFNANTGAPVWQFTTGGSIISSPAVAGGLVYFGSNDNNIYAVNAKAGQQKWSATTGSAVGSAPAVANGIVYVAGEDGKLYALNADNGITLWTGTLGSGTAFSSAAVANGVVYVGTPAHDVEAFDAFGCGAPVCSPLRTLAAGDTVNSSPAVSDGTLYFGSNDGRLYASALDAGNNPAYAYRKGTQPPSYASLHPDMRLKPVRR